MDAKPSPSRPQTPLPLAAGQDWVGAVTVAASMIFWTIYAVLPVDLAWSSTASSAAHLR